MPNSNRLSIIFLIRVTILGWSIPFCLYFVPIEPPKTFALNPHQIPIQYDTYIYIYYIYILYIYYIYILYIYTIYIYSIYIYIHIITIASCETPTYTSHFVYEIPWNHHVAGWIPTNSAVSQGIHTWRQSRGLAIQPSPATSDVQWDAPYVMWCIYIYI